MTQTLLLTLVATNAHAWRFMPWQLVVIVLTVAAMAGLAVWLCMGPRR